MRCSTTKQPPAVIQINVDGRPVPQSGHKVLASAEILPRINH
ncbi:MAG TPA: hypothetical protein VGR45_10110 [Stellaceae bacterium]|nr:hypothetical protein [Stellaceae bacterium]HEV2301059.1 hypothetical protein [Stellaceae bacterium]